MSIQLEYGLRDNRIVCISELSESERGEACKCECPYCHRPLLAKMGEIRQHHFAHKGISCEIAKAQQTALHMLAVEVLNDEKNLLVPGITIDKSHIRSIPNDIISRELPNRIKFKNPMTVHCKSAQLEFNSTSSCSRISVRTDIGRLLLAEVLVPGVKRQQYDGADAFLSIDLRKLYEKTIGKAELRAILTEKLEGKTWIFNPRYEEGIKWAEKEYEKMHQDAKDAYLDYLISAARPVQSPKPVKARVEVSYPKPIKTKAVKIFRCEMCGCERPDTEMSYYISDDPNGGICFECSRKMK